MTPTPDLYAKHHAENQERFQALEKKVDVNTAVTEKLAGDTAELVEMWKDAGVFFKWMRRFGTAALWISKVVLALGAVYAGIRYGWKGDK